MIRVTPYPNNNECMLPLLYRSTAIF
jgi:hypothetical protein